MMIGGLHKDATDLSHRLAALDNLLKGYPEYNPDQNRGEDGKWTGGSASTGAARGRAARAKTPGERKPRGPTLRQRYEQRFGHPPPKSMSRYAMERWIKGPTKTAPRSYDDEGKHRPSSAEVQDAAERMRDIAERLRGRLDDIGTKHQERQREIARDALDMRDEMKGWNEGVWRDPTTLDSLWEALTSLDAVVPTLLLGPITGGISVGIYGTAVGAVGAALLVRYVYRKLVTLGAYRGVRKPDSYMEIFHG